MNPQAAYRILELPEGAPRSRIKEAYRDLAKVWHPDRFDGEPRLRERATRKLQQLNRAYKFLKSYRPKPPPVPDARTKQGSGPKRSSSEQRSSSRSRPKPRAQQPPPPKPPPPRSRPEPSRVTEVWFEEPKTDALDVLIQIILYAVMAVVMYGCSAILGM